MSDNLKKYSFSDLLKQGKVRIPKIQRDYAQGRTTKKVNEIRKTFVHTLLLVIKGKRPATELDFVYGSNKNSAFEPLDGQQRLTTLFLLHWMMGFDNLCTEDGKHSLFTYETRNTSQEFCDELVQHKAKQFVDEAKKKTESNGKEFTPSKIIRGRDWFKWEWKSDPTILSMLVMIDAIYDEMGLDRDLDLSVCRDNLNKITFNLLNLGDFGLSNELFIKMNARGKQLSDFDKLKSTLEEELQIQQTEKDKNGKPLATSSDDQTWRKLMDDAWIDLFWHKYARNTIIETEQSTSDERQSLRLDAAKNAELQFKKLLLRLIALQLFENEASKENVLAAAYQIDENKVDNLISVYLDSLTDLRSNDKHVVVPNTQVTISFPKLISDFNHLIYLNNSVYGEVTALLPEITHIDNNDKTLFDSFLEAKVPNDVELTFYAMLLFLRAFPSEKNENGIFVYNEHKHKQWLVNLQYWVRAMRNILLNDNNNQRIDKMQYALEATQSLKKVIADLKQYVNEKELSMNDNETVVLQFFANLDKTYSRLDNQSFNEEKVKAGLRLSSSNWCNCLDKVEGHHYLWGQIRCLLNWSEKDIDIDINKFTDYSNRLVEILDTIDTDNRKYYCAILAFAPDSWRDTNRLFQYNKDRDNSFKRCLREHTREGQTYGQLIKSLIDNWKDACENSSASDYLDGLISDKINTAEPWVRVILKTPEIIDEAWNKRLYSVDGHVVLAQRKTSESHCFDPLFLYFKYCCKKRQFDENTYKMHDSKGEYAHAFELSVGDTKYLVSWSGSDYSIKINESEPQTYTAKDTLELIGNIIDNTNGKF